MTQSLTERLEFHGTWLRDRRLTRQANLIDEVLERLIELEELALTHHIGKLPEIGSPFPYKVTTEDETGENDEPEES